MTSSLSNLSFVLCEAGIFLVFLFLSFFLRDTTCQVFATFITGACFMTSACYMTGACYMTNAWYMTGACYMTEACYLAAAC